MKSKKVFLSLILGVFIFSIFSYMVLSTNTAWAVDYLVQSGQTTIAAGSTSQTITLGTVVTPSQTFVLVYSTNNQNTAEHPATFMASAELSIDGTQVIFDRGGIGTGTEVANISYLVIQSPNISVQHGSYTMGASEGMHDITLSTAADMNKSLVVLSRRGSVTYANHVQTQVTGYLTTETNLQLKRDTTGTAIDVEWQVVTFTDETTVQTDEVTFGNSTTATDSLFTSVELSRSWLYMTVRCSGASGMAYSMVRGRLTATDTITFNRRVASGTVIPVVRWFVVEFPDGRWANVQRGSVSTAATSDTVLDAPITAVDTSKTFLYHTNDGNGTGNAYPRPYWVNRFSTTTNAQFQRWYTGQHGTINWQAVRMAGPIPITRYVDDDGLCGGNSPCYTNIGAALSDANDGDTIIVYDGTYTEDVTIDKNYLILQSVNGRDSTYIVGQVKFDASTADLTGCTLDGFDIHGSSESNGLVFVHAFWERTDYENPTIRKITDTYIQNCNVRDNPSGPGIRLHGAAAPTIQNNLIHDNAGRGIDVPSAINSSGDILSSCSYNNYCGTLLSPGPTEYITITQNSIYNNESDGIRLHGWYGTSSSTYQPDRLVNVAIDGNNEIYSNYPPLPFPEGSGISLAYLNEAHIENNQIHDNGSPYGAGILTNAVDSLTIQGNQIYENMMAGIRITPYGAGDLITIGGPSSSDGNDIYNNRTGIVFRDGGSPGTFTDGSLIQKNYIHNNARAGIAIGQGNLAGGSQMTYQGKITITQNNICQNGRGGIGIHTSCYLCDTCCELEITKNDIYNSTTRGGIHTGDDWGRLSIWGSTTVNVTIKQNKVHHNYLGGIDVRHATGVIKNNLAYRNYRAGIRIGPGVDQVINNTMTYNGDNLVIKGGGVIHDDPDTCDESCQDTDGNCAADCEPDGNPDPALVVKNNIAAYNIKAGTRACECNRDYNLYYDNWYGYGYGNCSWTVWPGCKKRQLGGCWPVALNEVFADPYFKDMANDDYRLQRESEGDDNDSPAIGTGDGGVDMGAYGGSDPINDGDFLQPPTIIHCLIDEDTDTGNSPEGGTILFFDLGGTYTVKHVRLYGSADNTYIWTVYVASTSDGCTGTQVLTGWSVGGASDWYQGDVADTSGSYMKIETTGDIAQHSIFEFQFSEIDVPTLDEHWSTPVSTVSDCTDIYGQCAQ